MTIPLRKQAMAPNVIYDTVEALARGVCGGDGGGRARAREGS